MIAKIMEKQRIVITQDLESQLQQEIVCCNHDRLFVLTDENTQKYCWPLLAGYRIFSSAEVITIPASDSNKTLESVGHVWSELQRRGATRHSLLINLGGGMVTDLGGFAASTFKRGIAFINIPTTLLAMVDASVGGKTGFNFGGLKNEIGVFRNANSVIICTAFLQTMDQGNLYSGYAEMLKHALLSNINMWAAHLDFEPDTTAQALLQLQDMVADSIKVKEKIVEEDPTEKGIRKALNLGHTIGHAFESLALKHEPVLHGYAVAWGMVCELYLSTIKTGFPIARMRQTVRYIFEHYGRMPITCDDYPELLELMQHDKKNVAGKINFTLLSDVGGILINQTATQNEIEEALDFYREG